MDTVRVEPLFEGEVGTQTFVGYIQRNLRYPVSALTNVSKGVVYVEFTVDSTGQVTNVKILRGLNEDYYNKEAIRVISSSPRWIPGKVNDNPINVKFVCPVLFNFPANENEIKN